MKSTIQQFLAYLQVYYHHNLILEHFINQKKTHTHYHLPTFCSALLALGNCFHFFFFFLIFIYLFIFVFTSYRFPYSGYSM